MLGAEEIVPELRQGSRRRGPGRPPVSHRRTPFSVPLGVYTNDGDPSRLIPPAVL